MLIALPFPLLEALANTKVLEWPTISLTSPLYAAAPVRSSPPYR